MVSAACSPLGITATSLSFRLFAEEGQQLGRSCRGKQKEGKFPEWEFSRLGVGGRWLRQVKDGRFQAPDSTHLHNGWHPATPHPARPSPHTTLQKWMCRQLVTSPP